MAWFVEHDFSGGDWDLDFKEVTTSVDERRRLGLLHVATGFAISHEVGILFELLCLVHD